jgi:outer membrane receptor protein involved in Fe transport
MGSRNVLGVGGDWRWVDGESQEDTYNQLGAIQSPITPAVLALLRVSGGTQRIMGLFVQDVWTASNKLAVTVSARFDSWKNYNGHNLETNVPSGTPGPGNAPNLPDRDDSVGSPRVAAMYHVNERTRVWGDYSLGFRAPTLNELYRSFSVGAVRTFANPQLGPERLKGGEFGVMFEPARKVLVRATYFDNRVDDPVANVTIGTNQQQRQNLGATAIKGLQTDAEVTINEYVRVSGGYLLNDAKVTEADKNPAIVGLWLPQVPQNRGSVQVSYSNPSLFNAAVSLQAIGRQFEDDLNARIVPGETEPGLPGYTVLDFTAARSFGPNFDVFFGIQNIANTEIIAFTQPTTTGSPRMYNGGIRLRWSGR